MPKKKKSDIELLNETAERLQQIRLRIKTAEERHKAETNDDYALEKELKSEILLGMKAVGIASVRVTAGDTYSVSLTHDFRATNPIAEEAWAREQRCTSVDRSLLKARYKDALKKNALPDFVEAIPRETISIRAAKKDTDKEDAAEGTP